MVKPLDSDKNLDAKFGRNSFQPSKISPQFHKKFARDYRCTEYRVTHAPPSEWKYKYFWMEVFYWLFGNSKIVYIYIHMCTTADCSRFVERPCTCMYLCMYVKSARNNSYEWNIIMPLSHRPSSNSSLDIKIAATVYKNNNNFNSSSNNKNNKKITKESLDRKCKQQQQFVQHSQL